MKRIAELEETIALYENENGEIKARFDDAQTRLGAIRGEYEERLSSLTDELEAQRSATDKKEAQFDEEIALLKQDISSRLEEIESLKGEIAEKSEASGRSIRTLEEGIVNRDERISLLNEEMRKVLSEKEESVRNLESIIQAHQGTISERERELAALNARISDLAENLALRELELADALQLGSKLTQELAEGNEIQKYLSEEIKSAGAVITEKEHQIRTLLDSEKKLNGEIAVFRDHIRKLEISVKNLKDTEMGLNGEVKTSADRIAKQQNEIEELNQFIHQKKMEIADLTGKESRLHEELKLAHHREENSKEEGRLIARIIHSVASSGTLQEMLPVIREQFKERGVFERISLLSFIGEDRLLPEAALCGDRFIEDVHQFVIPLHDTVFGEAAASQHSMIFRNLKERNVDLPIHEDRIEKILGEHPARAYAIIPLIANQKTEGIMTLGAMQPNAFDDGFINLMNALSPYLARSVQYNMERRELTSIQKRSENQNRLRAYLEKKYQRGAASTATTMEEGGDLFLHMPTSRKTESDLTGWAERLAHLIEKRLNATVQIDIDPSALESLRSITKHNFPHLFWFFAEASDNIIRHSEATRTEYVIRETDTSIQLRIGDNGEGLLRKCGTEDPRNGSGFGAMRSLIELCGGDFRSSKNEDGTGLKIEAVWDKGDTTASFGS
jgi:hypothetical protein